MATWTGYETTPAVLAQAEKWKSKCLIENGSVFSDQALWTVENFADLKSLFIGNPILGSQKFYEKLTIQLDGASPEITKLAAESLWLLLLFVGDRYFGASTKTDRIREIWELSGDELPQSPEFSADALAGVANPGTAFLTKIPDEYGFLIELLLAWKQMSTERRTLLLNEAPWELCQWVESINGSATRAFRHMFLYFCYPSHFERICSKNHKRQLYDSFAEILDSDQDHFSRDETSCNLDRAILSIREKLEGEYGTSEIDFYKGSLRDRWGKKDKDARGRQPKAGSVLPSDSPRVWIEKTLVKGNPNRQSGANRLGEALWSPQRARNGADLYANMRLVARGDVVLHLTDNSGFTGKSLVAEEVNDQFVCLADTEWADQPGYRVQLSDFQILAPELPRDAFLKDPEIGADLLKLLGSEDGHGLFYNKNLELNQGAYLSRAPRALVTLLNSAYQKIAGRKLVEVPDVDTPFERLKANPMQTKSLNTIYYGPPGTGKTYVTARRAVEICDGQAPNGNGELRERYDWLVKQKQIEFVTFHQTYGYEEFVEGLRPDTGGNENGESISGFRLQPVDGVLKRIADRARKFPSNSGPPPPHVLIIDEINRANISKVMGELITLLEEDKRAGAMNEIAVTLPHSGEAFSLPPNLHIIGTMNTADRSIALLDTALRRRFQFVEMPPKPEILQEIDGVDVSSVLQNVNSRLEWFLGTDQLIGHAWLMTATTIAELDAVMSNKIIPLLREYFHEDLDRVRAVLGGGDKFIRREGISAPPGIDDYGEQRWKFVDRYMDGGSYGLEAYAEAIVGAEPANTE